MIYFYQPHEIPAVWDEVEPDIIRALDRGSVYTPEMVYDGLRAGLLQLFTARGVTLVTALIGDTCLLLALAGKFMKSWLPLLPQIEEWARNEGCVELRIQGRKGWARLLGFEITGQDELGLTIMRKYI